MKTKTILATLLLGLNVTSSVLAADSGLKRIEVWPTEKSQTEMLVIEELPNNDIRVSLCSRFNGSRCRKHLGESIGRTEITKAVMESMLREITQLPKASLGSKIGMAVGAVLGAGGGVVNGKIHFNPDAVKGLSPVIDPFGVNDVGYYSPKRYAMMKNSGRVGIFGAIVGMISAGFYLSQEKDAEMYLRALLMELPEATKGISIDFNMESTLDELESLLKYYYDTHA